MVQARIGLGRAPQLGQAKGTGAAATCSTCPVHF